MAYTQNDITSPNARMSLRGSASHDKYVFRDSEVTPEVGGTITIHGQSREVRRVERQSKLGERSAAVQDI